MVSVGILILFFEKPRQTIECINSFLPASVPIYVLNNNSSIKASRRVEKFINRFSNIHYYKSDENLGVARGRNFLIRKSEEDWLFFPDNDIIMKTAGWKEKVNRHILDFPNFDVFIPRMYEVHEKCYAKNKSFYLHKRLLKEKIYEIIPDEVNSFPGGASFISRDLFYRHGFYDESMGTSEDYEYSIRCFIKDEPIKCKPINDIEVVHNHKRVRTKSDKKSVKIRYDKSKMQSTYNDIEKKHSIKFDHNWEYFADRQIYEMTKKNRFTEFKKRLHYYYLKFK